MCGECTVALHTTALHTMALLTMALLTMALLTTCLRHAVDAADGLCLHRRVEQRLNQHHVLRLVRVRVRIGFRVGLG